MARGFQMRTQTEDDLAAALAVAVEEALNRQRWWRLDLEQRYHSHRTALARMFAPGMENIYI